MANLNVKPAEVKRFTQFDGFENPLGNLKFSELVLEDITFNSAEQCFQYFKAKYFNDEAAMKEIMRSNINPVECLKIGEQLDTSRATDDWPIAAMGIMRNICFAKVDKH